MGCAEWGFDCFDDEKPPHKVTLTRRFYMMKSEVAQGLCERVMGSNPSEYSSLSGREGQLARCGENGEPTE